MTGLISAHRRCCATLTRTATLVFFAARLTAADSISNVALVASTPSSLVITLRTNYDSANGDGVWVRAVPTRQSLGATVEATQVGCVGWRTRFGESHAYLQLDYAGTGALQTTGLRIYFERYDTPTRRARILTADFPLAQTWLPRTGSVAASNYVVRANPRTMRFETSFYPPQLNPTLNIRFKAEPLRYGAIMAAPFGFTTSVGAPRAGGIRSVSASLEYLGPGVTYSDALLFSLFEDRPGGPRLALAVVPMPKQWSASTADTDGDGLSNVGENSLGTNPWARDTDNDGLEDSWEVEGYRVDGVQWADSNLPLLGASPRQRDVFVEADFLSAATHDHHLPPEVVTQWKQFYGGLAVSNPDGTRGVRVHIINDNALPFDGNTGGVAGMNAFRGFFPARKNRIYHWMIVTHGTGGQAWTSGNRLVGGSGQGSSSTAPMSDYDRFLAYAVGVHELGHNLSLWHEGRNGANQSNCKANYPSLMNYAYDYSYDCSPYTLADTRIRFSRGGTPTLDENRLNEIGTVGLAAHVKGYDADFLPCNFLGANSGNIDWNLNRVYDVAPVRQDLDALPPSCCRQDSAGTCIGGDGWRSDQRDDNDLQRIATGMAGSIAEAASNAARATESFTDAANGWQYERDLAGLQPVCGLPAWPASDGHPWLRVNPVFALAPGMPIRHPVMRRWLAPYLDAEGRLRADVQVEQGPRLEPEALVVPKDRPEGAAVEEER